MRTIFVFSFILLLGGILYAQEIYYRNGDLFISYKGREYLVMQYLDNDNRKYYSTQYWPDRDNNCVAELPKGVVFIFNSEGKLLQLIKSLDLYWAEMRITDDLELTYHCGNHWIEKQTWTNKDGKLRKSSIKSNYMK